MEALQFVFSSFWIFFGTLCLITVTGSAVAEIVRALRRTSEARDDG